MMNEKFYNNSFDVEPYPHLQFAVGQLGYRSGKVAVDVGCGSGRDTRYLLDKGFSVHAYDSDQTAIAFLNDKLAAETPGNLVVRVSTFNTFEYPPSDLINACCSLFFCHPAKFEDAWNKIRTALKPGGIFCGHFMGPNDSWAKLGRGDLTVHDEAAFDELMQDFTVAEFTEIEGEGVTCVGREKFWHLYSVVAVKR